jgi:hypothetical protein
MVFETYNFNQFQDFSFSLREAMMFKFAPFLALFILGTLYAEERYPIIEGGAITSYISPTGLTRIVAIGDRITTVKDTMEQFHIDKESQLARMDVQTFFVDNRDPIQLYITTEIGNSYQWSSLMHAFA